MVPARRRRTRPTLTKRSNGSIDPTEIVPSHGRSTTACAGDYAIVATARDGITGSDLSIDGGVVAALRTGQLALQVS
jgi:hypothetical protein